MRMTKVHPNGAVSAKKNSSSSDRLKQVLSDAAVGGGEAVVLTVWKKSLLMSCSGFTVFDSMGNLVFRVDNYLAGSKGQTVLMDATGKPLLTVRRKRLSLGDNWLVFDGETAVNPRFSARKRVNLLNTKCLVQVSSGSSSNNNENGNENGNGSGFLSPTNKNLMYEIEGSYTQRCCAVYDRNRRCVAEIKRKEAPVGGVAFGADVFRLVVQPDMDHVVAMALVVLLDQMFEPSKRFSP